MRVVSALKLKKVRETVTFALESQAGARVTEASILAQVLDPLLKDIPVDLIICDHPEGSVPLLKFLSAMDKSVPVLIVLSEGTDEKARAEAGKLGSRPGVLAILEGADIVPDVLKWAEVARARKPADSGAEGETGVEESDEADFCRIKVGLLRGMDSLQSDLYIRLGPSKFLKLFNKGDLFEAQDRQKVLIDKKVEFLFVKKTESGPVLGHLQKKLVEVMSKAAENPGQFEQVAASAHEAASEVIGRLGMTSEVRDLIKTNILVTVKTIGSSPKFKGVLARLMVERDKYISSHSVLLSQLTCAVAAAMDWGSEITFHKLTMASFFHDIVLQDHKLAQLQTKDEVMAATATYPQDKIREYLLHTAKAAQLSSELGEVPPDVDTIITQHHERPDGTGFPRGLSAKHFIPLSCVFIVAHDLLGWILQKGERFDLAAFVEARKDLYGTGTFRQVLQKLQSVEF